MTIEQLIRNAKPASHHAWRIETEACVGCRDERIICTSPRISLWHYGTRMLTWYKSAADGCNVALYASTGYGSVSDQNGMNIAFRTLNLPYRFNRSGGARIDEVHTLYGHDLPNARYSL